MFVKIFVKNDFIKDNELATGSPFVDQAVATAMCTEQMSSFQQAFRWHVAGAACHTATAPWSDCSAPRTGCIHVGLRAALQCDGVMKLHCTGGSSPDQVPARGPGLAEWAAWLAGQRLEHTVPAWQLNWSKLCVVTGWAWAGPWKHLSRAVLSGNAWHRCWSLDAERWYGMLSGCSPVCNGLAESTQAFMHACVNNLLAEIVPTRRQAHRLAVEAQAVSRQELQLGHLLCLPRSKKALLPDGAPQLHPQIHHGAHEGHHVNRHASYRVGGFV